MEKESYVDPEVEVREEVQQLEPCAVCGSEIASGNKATECDWCGLALHEQCEQKLEMCPRCKRYLPLAKAKALAADRRHTSILVALPFVVVEAIIAIYSWLNHPGPISVPDIENWFSVGLIVNVVLLIVALIGMGAVARRGEGVKEPKGGTAQSE
ncbi:MAG: hypothetical protein KAR39_06710 [Thermoplasmata archaeon]|nr:hypothetical protein [Thermoplasmata archaeon]